MISNIDIERYMKSLQQGDLDAFDEIYQATYKSVFYVIYGIVKSHQVAEDVSQNTYLRVCEKINLYKEGTNPVAWIITIARNLALNELRKNQKEVLVDVVDLNYVTDEDDRKPEPAEETPLIDLAKKNLSDLEFQIVMMCAVNNYKRREVAKMLNLPISTVTWHYNNSLKKLRKIVEGGDHRENERT
jgi:RNA polymerase sigma-70 factor (ECF subfamily)